MSHPPSPGTWLLTNDDGIAAPGLMALTQAIALAVSSSDVAIVAPLEHQSGCGHQVTTTTPLQLQVYADGWFPGQFQQAYAVTGTPVDCVRVALKHLFPTLNLVISGINAGANLGADVYISGTVAAVREAAFHNIPGIAVSQYRHRQRPIDWTVTTHLTARAIKHLLRLPLDPGSFWNVNLPHLSGDEPEPDLIFCQPSPEPLPTQFRVEGDLLFYEGDYASRDRQPGSDVDVCFSGHIAITQLRV